MVRLHDTNNKFWGRGSTRRSSVILGEPQDYTRTLRAATRLDSETPKGGDSTTCSRMWLESYFITLITMSSITQKSLDTTETWKKFCVSSASPPAKLTTKSQPPVWKTSSDSTPLWFTDDGQTHTTFPLRLKQQLITLTGFCPSSRTGARWHKLCEEPSQAFAESRGHDAPDSQDLFPGFDVPQLGDSHPVICTGPTGRTTSCCQREMGHLKSKKKIKWSSQKRGKNEISNNGTNGELKCYKLLNASYRSSTIDSYLPLVQLQVAEKLPF